MENNKYSLNDIIPIAATNAVALDARYTAATFEGIGTLSAGASSRLLMDYPKTQRNEILDFLFKPKFGASFQHLKVEIGGDVDSTDGTEPSIARTRGEFTNPKPEYFNRGYEWWLMKEAKKRNPKIIFDALQWGAPGWIGEGNFYSQDNADFIAAFIRGAKKYHDIDINYCGCWNEKDYDITWIKLLRHTLDAHGLNSVHIVAADQQPGMGDIWKIAEQLSRDAELAKAVDVLGAHYPQFNATVTAKNSGKRLWSSEDGPWSGEWGVSTSPCAGLPQAYNRNYITGNMTKTIVWSPITAYYDIFPLPNSGMIKANQPWCGHYEIHPAIWMTAHTTQFIEPGWKYLAGAACIMLPDGGSRIAAVSPDGRNLSLVIETFGANVAQPLAFKLYGGLSPRILHFWRSTKTEQFTQLPDVPVADGVFSFTVDPEAIYSLTTTEGQCKGSTLIPESRPFPLPYNEDFESYTDGSTSKYWSDFYGAFEVAERKDGGRCLKQVITRRGIQWTFDHEPVTLIGSPELCDYEIACDVCFDFKQAAWIYGRVDSISPFQDSTNTLINGIPAGSTSANGYGLCLSANGSWQLRDDKKQLLSGTLKVNPGEWHRAGLIFKRTQITVILNGNKVGTITDTSHKRGLAALGCGYEEVKFDNVSIVVPGGAEPRSIVRCRS